MDMEGYERLQQIALDAVTKQQRRDGATTVGLPSPSVPKALLDSIGTTESNKSTGAAPLVLVPARGKGKAKSKAKTKAARKKSTGVSGNPQVRAFAQSLRALSDRELWDKYGPK